MKKNVLKTIIVLLGAVLLSCMALYIGLAIYYADAFEYGTFINGVYCTGKEPETVNKELSANFSYGGLTIIDKDKNTFFISPEDISYNFDFLEALNIYIDRQNPFLWVESIFTGHDDTLAPVVSYNKDQLLLAYSQLPILEVRNDEDLKLEIIKTNYGYDIINERCGVIDNDMVFSVIRDAIENSEEEVDLYLEGCYRDLELTPKMQSDLEIWDKINEFQNFNKKYMFGNDEEIIDSSIVCDWIMLDGSGDFLVDESGNLVLDEKKLTDYIDCLGDKYDTVGIERTFHNSNNEDIVVSGGTYGNLLDRDTEKEYLLNAFLEKNEEDREPEYLQRAMFQGKDDIGDTYIEVDLGRQHMYYYVKGELIVDTPVVSGNVSLHHSTPSGVDFVYMKQTDRVLRGPDYASFVHFWMPVIKAVGIHDSPWRSEYGGSIYKTAGSHGCVNTPYDAMKTIYDMCEIGTPVIMFY